jgi:hypothetical protein
MNQTRTFLLQIEKKFEVSFVVHEVTGRRSALEIFDAARWIEDKDDGQSRGFVGGWLQFGESKTIRLARRWGVVDVGVSFCG